MRKLLSIVMTTAGIVHLCILGPIGCASASRYDGMNAEEAPEQVISRIDEFSERPSWLKESEPFLIEQGKVVSLGITEIPGEHRVDAAYRIALNNAEAAIAGAIENRLEFIFQNSEEGTEVGATQVRYIGAEATRLVASSLRPGKRYWEKIAYSTDSGARQTKYRVFASVEMPEADFKRAIINAIRRAEGRAGLSAEFTKKVDEQWERFAVPQNTIDTGKE